MSAQLKQYPKDDEYYLADIVFLVEGHLFKVPRYYFANMSEVFCNTFALPVVEGAKKEGSCDDSPFHLEGISKLDFKPFLRALIKEVHRDSTLSREEWKSALKLATMWGFRDVRRRAIIAMEQTCNLTAVDKINLGREFKVVNWFSNGVQCFLSRTTSISIEEVALIGIDIAVPLFHIRERMAKYGGYTASWMNLVEGGLKEELAQIKASNAIFDALPSFYFEPKS